MFGPEHLMNAAVALPEDHLAAFKLFLGAAAERIGVRIPDWHLVERDAHAERRVAAQMLIGEEHHAAGARERPFERGLGIGGGANDAAVPADERLQARCRVDVRDGRDVFRIEDFAELIPGVFDLVDGGHVGHRAAGGQIGQHDGDAFAAAFGELLWPVRQDVGRLGHEVHAAEYDVPGTRCFRRRFGSGRSYRRVSRPAR